MTFVVSHSVTCITGSRLFSLNTGLCHNAIHGFCRDFDICSDITIYCMVIYRDCIALTVNIVLASLNTISILRRTLEGFLQNTRF